MKLLPVRLAISATLATALGLSSQSWYVFGQAFVMMLVCSGPRHQHPAVDVIERALLTGAWVAILDLYLMQRLRH